MNTFNHSLRRRLSLLAGSSLGAVSILAVAGAGAAVLAPGHALAADECGPLVTDPNTGQTQTVTCAPGTYPTGISYSGDVVPLILQGAIVIPDNGLTVDATTSISLSPDWAVSGDPQINNSGGAGISLTSGGDISGGMWTWGSGASITGQSGLVINGSGNIFVSTGQASITATDPNGYGIYVENAGNGFTSVSSGNITSAGTGAFLAATSGYNGLGVGNVTAAGDGVVGTLSGSGLLAFSAGTVTAGGDGISASAPNGNVSVTLYGNVNAGSGTAVRILAGGTTYLMIGDGVTVTGDSLAITSGGAFTIDNFGTLTSAGESPTGLMLQSDAPQIVLTNYTGTMIGGVNFSGASGGVTITNTHPWYLGGQSVLGSGDDMISNAFHFVWGTGSMMVSSGASIDFGAGTDTLENHGPLMFSGTFTLTNLEKLRNSNVIIFGTNDGQHSNGVTTDRLAADGASYFGTGENGMPSTFLLDVNLGAGSQTSCAAAVVADCLSLVGGATSGTTHLIVNEVGAGAAPVLGTRVVLVDVSGGASTPNDFVLEPGMTGYRTDDLLGPGLDRGFVFYKFGYDAANQQFGFIAVPDHEVFEFAPMASQAQDVWYSTTGTWLERNTDLREALADDRGAGPAGWLKVASSKTDRHMEKDFQGDNPGFWTSYKQDTTEVIGGLDLLRAMADDQAFVAGVTLGYAKSDTDFDASPSSTSFKGMTYGAYATWLTGSLFVDGIVQVNKLDVEHKTDWIRAGDFGKGKLTSTGVQVEGGWRIPINENSAYVEPLASLAYVRTQIDDIDVPDAVFNANDATSLRGSLGARINGDVLHFDATTLNIAATGRVWDEFSAKNKGKLVAGGSANLEDDFGGTFGQVALTFALRSDSGRVSGFFNTGAKFNADYLSYDNAIGVRVRW